LNRRQIADDDDDDDDDDGLDEVVYASMEDTFIYDSPQLFEDDDAVRVGDGREVALFMRLLFGDGLDCVMLTGISAL